MVLNSNGNENPSSSPNEDRYLERRRRLFEPQATSTPAPQEETPTVTPPVAETTPANVLPQAFVLDDAPIRAAEDVLTEKRSEDSYEKSKTKLALRQWIAVVLLTAVAVATTSTLVNIAQNFFNRATETPTSAFTLEPTDTAELPLLPAFTPTANPETLETPAPTEISPYDVNNELQPNEGQCLGLGGSYFDLYQNKSGRMYIIAESKKADQPENARMMLVKDTNAQTSNKERCMVGIDMHDGTYLYNFDLDPSDRATDILILNKVRHTFRNFYIKNKNGKKVALFQLVGNGISISDDNDLDNQEQYVAIQSMYDRLNPPATPVGPTDTGFAPQTDSRTALASMLADQRAATQRKMHKTTGVF